MNTKQQAEHLARLSAHMEREAPLRQEPTGRHYGARRVLRATTN